MSESASAAVPASGMSAGALLRQARKAQGLHIAALAAAIKVTPQKLESLENDRYDELPDATFARALAKAVCRVLKIDAEPVLDLLPKGVSQGFERLGGGLNTPYQERSGRSEPAEQGGLRRPILWGALLLLVAAAVVLFAPIDLLSRFRRVEAPADAASTVQFPGEGGVIASNPLVAVPVPAPPPEPNASDVPTGAATASSANGGDGAPAGLIVVRTSKESWIEVVDAQGHTMLSRLMLAGESVALDGTPPLRLKVGNVKATQILFRGKPVDLSAGSRDNIARLELK